MSRITRREWLVAGRDLVVAGAAFAFVAVVLDWWLVTLATLTVAWGWVR